RLLPTQRLGPVRYARQRRRMVLRLVRHELPQRPLKEPAWPGNGAGSDGEGQRLFRTSVELPQRLPGPLAPDAGRPEYRLSGGDGPGAAEVMAEPIGGAVIEPLERGGIYTVTTVQMHHPTLIPDGVFEYQHAWGETVAEAMDNGFDQWFQVDF